MTSNTKFILLNGNYYIEGNNIFNLYNRALGSGDCLCETMHTCADRICFFDEHLAHLRKGMKMAQMQIPDKFMNANQEFYAEVSRLMSKNKIFRSANVTIMVYRAASPQQYSSDRVEYIVCAQPLPYLGYELNPDGIKIDIFEDFASPCGPFAEYETHAATLEKVIIRKTCIMRHISDMITLTPQKHLSQAAMGGNIFLINGNRLITPPIQDGCPGDTFRLKVMDAARELGMETCGSEHVTLHDIDSCEELFLGSTSHGIRWIAAYRSHRYIKKKVQAIYNKINSKYLAERIEDPQPIQ